MHNLNFWFTFSLFFLDSLFSWLLNNLGDLSRLLDCFFFLSYNFITILYANLSGHIWSLIFRTSLAGSILSNNLSVIIASVSSTVPVASLGSCEVWAVLANQVSEVVC